MIGKLMKHDIKRMSKVLIYLYAITLGFAGITRLINIGRNIQAVYILGQIFAGITISGIASILVNTFVHILRNFICSFYKDQSYLTHTLPVGKDKLLLSKYLSSLIVIVSSVVVSVMSLFILYWSESLMKPLLMLIETAVSGFNMSAGVFIALMVFVLFSQICSIMSMAFAAVVKANTYNHHRIMNGLLWFALFYFGASIVSILAIALVFLMTGNIDYLLAEVMPQSAFVTIMITGLVVYCVYSVLFYFLCRRWFKKGVNVD